MANPLIRCDRVSKVFCRDLRRSLWYGLSDIANDLAFGLQSHPTSSAKDLSLRPEEFLANRDISFEVQRGECVGLVGHNGAGKTTLLKLLNGLIKPDTGRIEMEGRVAALIALGAGFNPILTGRENIYVNGAVLGQSRSTIRRHFDEIVAFSELESFVDSPVRSYSSGMQVRLGFAIATILVTPDILLLDEVLAVGDFSFRSKCLQRIQQICEQAAVVFVSHHETQLAQICNRGILLNQGEKAFDGSISDCLNELKKTFPRLAGTRDNNDRAISNLQFQGPAQCDNGLPLKFEIRFTAERPFEKLSGWLTIIDHLGQAVGQARFAQEDLGIRQGANHWALSIPNLQLAAGNYRLNLFVGKQGPVIHVGDVAQFRVIGPPLHSAAYQPHAHLTVSP